jgi:fucose 4-O-acetylase-like acetyltransferase
MNYFISQKFKFYSFISMLLLVYVHGYNLHNGYLQPFTVVEEPMTVTTFTEYFLANGLFRFRIPMLFIISGYLFALHDARPYSERMKKRLRTLGIPYLIWSAVALLITFAWQQFPATAQAVSHAQLDQLGDNRAYTQIGWGGILFRWILAPVAFQLWFIRSLLVYNAAYPLLLKAVTKKPAVWFGIVILLWLITFAVPFIESEGLLFFTLGIFLQKTNFNIEKAPQWLSVKIWAPVFIISAAIKTGLAFQFGWNVGSFITLSLLHKICVFSGLVTMWYGADALVKYCMNRKWFTWLSAFAFIIYALHVPLVNYCTQLIYMYGKEMPNLRLITFIILPLMISIVCVMLGAVCRKLLPKMYAIVTGGRGL